MYNPNYILQDIPTDQLLQRLIDYKIRKSKKYVQNSKRNEIGIEKQQTLIPQQQPVVKLNQYSNFIKRKLQTYRSKKDLSKYFSFNRKPFLSTSDVNSPKVMQSLSPQNHTNIVHKTNEFELERKPHLNSQHKNPQKILEVTHSISPDRKSKKTLQSSAQLIYQELKQLLEKVGLVKNLNQACNYYFTLFNYVSSSSITNLLEIKSSKAVNIWKDNIYCVEQVMTSFQRFDKQQINVKDTNEMLASQNEQLKLVIKSHSSLLTNLRSQLDALQQQVNEQSKQQDVKDPYIMKLNIPLNSESNHLSSLDKGLQTHPKLQLISEGKATEEQQTQKLVADTQFKLLNGQFNEDKTQIQKAQNDKLTMTRQLKIGTNLEDIRVDQNFQEEFMSKFDEFSLSWRQAAMQLKH